MRRVLRIAAAPVLLSLLTLPARSSAAETKLGGLIFGQFGMIASPQDQTGVPARGRSAFDVTRVYLQGLASFDERWKAKITLEGNTNSSKETTGNEGQNPVFLKFAYLEYSNLADRGLDLRAGQIPTPWNGFEEDIWGRRYVQKVTTDYQGVLNSADKGLAALYALPGGRGDLHLATVNGEGAQATEAGGGSGRQKDYMARLSLRPLPQSETLKGLRLHAYAQQGRSGLTSSGTLLPSRDRNRLIASTSFEHPRFHLLYSYMEAVTGVGTTPAANQRAKPKGYWLHGSLALPYSISLFARYDRFDPGLPTSYYPRSLAIAGVERRFNQHVRLAFDGQFIHGLRRDTGETMNETQLFVHCEAKF